MVSYTQPARRYKALESKEIAKVAACAASDKKAQDIILMDVSKILIITDYFLIMSGKTERQTKTVSAAIQEELKKSGILPIGKEGESEAKWILLDYGDVVIHIFRAQEREYYQLERLWKDVPVIRFEEGGEEAEPEISSYCSDQLNA